MTLLNKHTFGKLGGGGAIEYAIDTIFEESGSTLLSPTQRVEGEAEFVRTGYFELTNSSGAINIGDTLGTNVRIHDGCLNIKQNADSYQHLGCRSQPLQETGEPNRVVLWRHEVPQSNFYTAHGLYENGVFRYDQTNFSVAGYIAAGTVRFAYRLSDLTYVPLFTNYTSQSNFNYGFAVEFLNASGSEANFYHKGHAGNPATGTDQWVLQGTTNDLVILPLGHCLYQSSGRVNTFCISRMCETISGVPGLSTDPSILDTI